MTHRVKIRDPELAVKTAGAPMPHAWASVHVWQISHFISVLLLNCLKITEMTLYSPNIAAQTSSCMTTTLSLTQTQCAVKTSPVHSCLLQLTWSNQDLHMGLSLLSLSGFSEAVSSSPGWPWTHPPEHTGIFQICKQTATQVSTTSLCGKPSHFLIL